MSRTPDQKRDEPTDDERAGQTSRITVELDGYLGWDGFTASIVVHNETESELDQWAFRFVSTHKIRRKMVGAAGFKRPIWGAGFTSIACALQAGRTASPLVALSVSVSTATRVWPSVILENWMPRDGLTEAGLANRGPFVNRNDGPVRGR